MYDKELLQIVFACTLLFAVFAFFLVWFVIKHKNQKQTHSLEKQRLLFELETKELSLGFNERELVLNEVSQDIHDNIGQIAHLVRMNLHTIEEYSANIEQLGLIKYVSDLVGRIISETRYMGHSLNTDFIKEQGLYRMLEYDMERINASKQIKCFLDIEGEGSDSSITREAQLLIYRIAQEATHNTLQHANAAILEMQLGYHKDFFKMVIRDDGVGFDELLAKENGTIGIGNMYQRAQLLNGTLEIKSGIGRGCNVTLLVKNN